MTTQTMERSRALDVTLWAVQILLALLFTMAGTLKTFMPIDQLALKMSWVPAVPHALVRLIGLSELAGGLGLVLPGLFRVRQQLTPLAAVGLLTVMILAAGFHLNRLEFHLIGINLMLGALAAFVAWGRIRD